MPALTLSSSDPDAPDARACLDAYFALIQSLIPGSTAPHVTDPHAADFRPPDGLFLLARLGDDTIGCGSLRRHDATTGEVKRLWVAPAARGRGVARALMADLESAARRLGMTRLILDTNAALTEALALYAALGWTAIPPYTGPPADRWFGKTL